MRHETVRPASRMSRAARATPTASSFRTDTPIPGAPAAANASTSRSNDQPRVVISLIEKRTTKGRYPPPGASVKAPGPRPAPSAILAPVPTGGSGPRRDDVARTDRRWLLAAAALLAAWLGVFVGAGAIYRATGPHPRVSAFLRRVQHHAHGLLHLRGRRGSR